MAEMKNINTESEFKDRTGLIVRISNKRMFKRLMKFGLLHYFSSKMSYVLLYVDNENIEETIRKIEKENYVNSVEKSKLKELPIEYENVLEKLDKEIKDENKKDDDSIFTNQIEFY